MTKVEGSQGVIQTRVVEREERDTSKETKENEQIVTSAEGKSQSILKMENPELVLVEEGNEEKAVEVASLENRNFLRINLGGQTYTALLDTGAMLTLMNTVIAERFSPRIKPCSQYIRSVLGEIRRWREEQQTAFEELKRALTRAPVLAIPDFSKTFTVQCDASNYALGAVLTQELEDGEHPIAYLSRVLTPAERNYTTSEKECLAIIWDIKKLRPYSFQVITDHSALRWLQNLRDPTGRLAR